MAACTSLVVSYFPSHAQAHKHTHARTHARTDAHARLRTLFLTRTHVHARAQANTLTLTHIKLSQFPSKCYLREQCVARDSECVERGNGRWV